MKKIIFLTIFSGLALLVFTPSFSQADLNEGLGIVRGSGLSDTSEIKILNNIKDWLFLMAFVIFAIAVVASGLIMIASVGDSNAFGMAKKWLGYSIGGLVIVFLANKIFTTIQGLTGMGGFGTWQVLGMVLLNILFWLLGIMLVLAAISFVASGIVLIVSGGTPGMADRARQWITYSITGLAVAFSALTIMFTIFTLFGSNPLLSMVINFTLGFLGLGAPFTVQALLMGILRWLTGLLAILAGVALVTSGIMLIISGGTPGMADRAKRWIGYSVVGLIVALLAFVIINTVSRTVLGF